jgi:hypothetical protein
MIRRAIRGLAADAAPSGDGQKEMPSWHDTELRGTSFDRGYETLASEALPIQIEGTTGHVTSIAHLIADKLAAIELGEEKRGAVKRAQDISDLECLKQLSSGE